MRMSVRLEILVLTLVTMPWAPTTAPVPEDSLSQLTAERVRVNKTSIHAQRLLYINMMTFSHVLLLLFL